MHAALLRSGGTAMACSFDGCSMQLSGARRGPDLHGAAAGALRAVLLRRCDTAVACGRQSCLVLDSGAGSGLDLHAAAAGTLHAVLLRSGGTAVACGPARIAVGPTCVQDAAGGRRSALLRSDSAVAVRGCFSQLVEDFNCVQVAA